MARCRRAGACSGPAGETIELAATHALYPVLNQHRESTQAQNRAAGITWTVLAFGEGRGGLGESRRVRPCPPLARTEISDGTAWILCAP